MGEMVFGVMGLLRREGRLCWCDGMGWMIGELEERFGEELDGKRVEELCC
jgi:hypothetical protein